MTAVPKTPWYQDKEQLQAALNTAGSWANLSRQAHIPESTLKGVGSKFQIKPAKPELESAPGVVSEVELLKQENRELQSRLTEARRLEVFDSRSLNLLRENVKHADVKYRPISLPTDKALTTHTHVLQWSDDHAAERVSFAATNGLNEYNWEIMIERWQRMAHAIRSFKKNRPYPIDELVILGLGDKVTGDIHDELRETNEISVGRAAVKLGYDMGAFIESELVPLYKTIRYVSVVGNHGRTTKKPEFKDAAKNWDWISGEVLKLYLSNYEQITVETPDSFEKVVTVNGKNILCFHGDGVQSSMVGVPWGGIIRRASELYKLYAKAGILIDHFAIGHWHEANVVGQKAIWVNGSIKGQDEYGIKRHGGGQPPCQLLHTLHPTRGLVSTDYLML